MDAISSAKPEIVKYLEDADPKLWSRVHCEGTRYNIKTSNIAELINAVLKIAPGFPILFLLEFIRVKLGRWFYKRREYAFKLTTLFSRGVEYLQAIHDHYASPMKVERIDDWTFYVKGRKQNYLVELHQKKCSCGFFQTQKIPCSYAIMALVMSGQDISTVVCPSYGRDYLYAAVPYLPPYVKSRLVGRRSLDGNLT